MKGGDGDAASLGHTRAEPRETNVFVVRKPGFPELHPRRYRQRRRRLERSLAWGIPIGLVVLWQVASSRDWIDARIYPSPTDIVGTIEDLRDSGMLWSTVGISARRVLLGFALGAGVGLIFGFTMGISRLLRAGLEPLLSALYTVPKLALLPIFLTILGFGEAPVVVLIAVTVFFFVWIGTMSAIMAVPDGYQEAARSFRVNRLQMFRHVLLPAALPAIFVSLRMAAGVSVLVLVGIEFVIGGDGVGFLIDQGRRLFLLEQAYAGIVLAALLGFVFTSTVRLVGRALVPWDRSSTAGLAV